MLAVFHSYMSEIVFILHSSLIFVDVAPWLKTRAAITHTNYSACILMLDKREKNFFFLDDGCKN